MNILRESMTRIALEHITIRIWREEPLNAQPDNRDIMEKIKKIVSKPYNPLVLANQIIGFDRVNAVEVLDKNFQGEVLYRDWP